MQLRPANKFVPLIIGVTLLHRLASVWVRRMRPPKLFAGRVSPRRHFLLIIIVLALLALNDTSALA